MILEDFNTVNILAEDDNVVIFETMLTEHSSRIAVGQRNTGGGFVKKSMQGITGFIKDHPVISAGLAMVAYKQYKKNQRKTVTFYSRDVQEKKLYRSIVDTLMKTGNYQKVKAAFVDGGYLWVLKNLRP